MKIINNKYKINLRKFHSSIVLLSPITNLLRKPITNLLKITNKKYSEVLKIFKQPSFRASGSSNELLRNKYKLLKSKLNLLEVKTNTSLSYDQKICIFKAYENQHFYLNYILNNLYLNNKFVFVKLIPYQIYLNFIETFVYKPNFYGWPSGLMALQTFFKDSLGINVKGKEFIANCIKFYLDKIYGGNKIEHRQELISRVCGLTTLNKESLSNIDLGPVFTLMQHLIALDFDRLFIHVNDLQNIVKGRINMEFYKNEIPEKSLINFTTLFEVQIFMLTYKFLLDKEKPYKSTIYCLNPENNKKFFIRFNKFFKELNDQNHPDFAKLELSESGSIIRVIVSFDVKLIANLETFLSCLKSLCSISPKFDFVKYFNRLYSTLEIKIKSLENNHLIDEKEKNDLEKLNIWLNQLKVIRTNLKKKKPNLLEELDRFNKINEDIILNSGLTKYYPSIIIQAEFDNSDHAFDFIHVKGKKDINDFIQSLIGKIDEKALFPSSYKDYDHRNFQKFILEILDEYVKLQPHVKYNFYFVRLLSERFLLTDV